jgi:AcrR family transcriptional regulator
MMLTTTTYRPGVVSVNMDPPFTVAMLVSGAMPRRTSDYHHGNLRRALLAAGMELLEQEGVAGITTRALARKLGVSHAAPHRHFPDRAALLAELAAVAFERFTHALRAAMRKQTRPDQALAAMGRAYVRFAIDRPEQLRLMFNQDFPRPPPPRLQQASQAAYEVLQAGVGAALEPGASDQRIRAEVFGSWALVHGAAMLWLDGSLSHQLPARGARAAFLALTDAAIARMIAGLPKQR